MAPMSASGSPTNSPALCRLRTLNVVAIGFTSGCQCVVQQLDAVLAPEHLAVEHVAGRAECIDLECFFNILLVSLFNALALGVRKELLCRKSDAIGEHNERLLVGKISLISPHSRKGLPQKLIGIGP